MEISFENTNCESVERAGAEFSFFRGKLPSISGKISDPKIGTATGVAGDERWGDLATAVSFGLEFKSSWGFELLPIPNSSQT